MNCPKCGAPGPGSFCSRCGARVDPDPAAAPASAAPTPAKKSNQNVMAKAAGITVGLVALGLGSFFAVNAMSKHDDSPHTAVPQTVSASVAPTSTPAAPPTSGGGSSTASQGSAPASQTSSGQSGSAGSSSGSSEGAAISQLNEWASQGRSATNIAEDSWGARLSSKWVGATDKDAGHPQPYTAVEIEAEMKALRETYGADLHVLKLSDAGLQNSAIKGRDGWMAVVVNADTATQDKAKAWCSAHFNGDITRCGEQHLNAPHDN